MTIQDHLESRFDTECPHTRITVVGSFNTSTPQARAAIAAMIKAGEESVSEAECPTKTPRKKRTTKGTKKGC